MPQNSSLFYRHLGLDALAGAASGDRRNAICEDEKENGKLG